jgi:hypothetical protein
MQTDKHKIVFEANGETITIPLTNGLEVREKQNPECNKNASVCCLYNNQKVCFKIKIETDKDGDLSLGEICPCKNNKSNKIKIEV